MVSQFGGYNHNLRIGDGEFYDMQNMSSDLYPALSPRLPRGKVRQLTKPNGLFSHNALAWVDGTEFWYAGSRVDGFTLADSKKTFVAIGAYIVIFPDKKYFNTENQTFGNLGETVNLSSVTVAPCRLDGAEITPTVSATAPADPADIGLSREALRDMFPLVQLMRFRYNVLDLAKRGGFYDKIVSPLFAKGGVFEI